MGLAIYGTPGLGENSFEGNQTFNGTANTAPNQTTTWSSVTSSMLVTKAEIIARDLQRAIAGPPVYHLSNFSGVASSATSGGAVTNQCMYSEARANAGSGNYAISRFYVGPGLSVAASSSGGYLNFSKKLLLGAMITRSGNQYTEGVGRIIVGSTSAYLPSADPAAACLGWKIQDRTLSAIMCNNAGTYSVVGTDVSNVLGGSSVRQNIWLSISSDGAGNVSWSANATGTAVVVATTASGPTATQGNQYLTISSYNDGVYTNQNDIDIVGAMFGSPE